jgi:predicted  nucleic acid-binding Zn-ribbon protein
MIYEDESLIWKLTKKAMWEVGTIYGTFWLIEKVLDPKTRQLGSKAENSKLKGSIINPDIKTRVSALQQKIKSFEDRFDRYEVNMEKNLGAIQSNLYLELDSLRKYDLRGLEEDIAEMDERINNLYSKMQNIQITFGG